LISYVELRAQLDLRDDPVRPRKGGFFSVALQKAGGVLQGDADDYRVQPEARGYLPLGRRFVLAARAGTGFLFPQNYGDAAQKSYDKTATTADTAAITRDDQILFFRGLFSGGPTSNRGYPLKGVGPHSNVPYLLPTADATNPNAACTANNTSQACLYPTGGLSLWEASVELRANIKEPFMAAAFCDSGDVSPFKVDLRFDRPHLSCGLGARYDFSYGALRFDIAYRIPGVQTLGDSFGEGVPPTLFGAPIALAFGLGEAF
jgi:outer membrane protein insertion porin family/translocation and assembly module TamA